MNLKEIEKKWKKLKTKKQQKNSDFSQKHDINNLLTQDIILIIK